MVMRNTLILLMLLLPAMATGQAAHPNVLLIIADDMSFAHTSFAGDPVIKTPAFDRIAREGVFFTNAHTIAASCTPSRASLLTGRPIWQLEQGAQLHGTLPAISTRCSASCRRISRSATGTAAASRIAIMSSAAASHPGWTRRR
jgi:hypothetical protein